MYVYACMRVYKTHLYTTLFNILQRFTRCIVKAVRLKTATRLDAPLRMPHNESTKLWCWLDSGGRDRDRVPSRGKGVMSFQVCKRSHYEYYELSVTRYIYIRCCVDLWIFLDFIETGVKMLVCKNFGRGSSLSSYEQFNFALETLVGKQRRCGTVCRAVL